MPLPITRIQLEQEVGSRYHFLPDKARAILDTLEAGGAIEFHGPEMTILNPTTHEAHLITGLVNGALGRSLGSTGRYRIKEFLESLSQQAAKRPRSRKN